MMKVLITGSGGFCGKHLISYLKRQAVEVHTLGIKETLNQNHHRILDILNIPALTEILLELRPDRIFHLAGISHSEDPTTVYRVNTQDAVALLRSMMDAERFETPVLLAGTSAEYGMISDHQLPIDETLPAHPYNHYGISKLAQTFVALSAAKKLTVIPVRPFNIIGPGMPSDLVVQSFAVQVVKILKGISPSHLRVGNIASSRDFIDVRDTIEIYWKLCQTPLAHGELINVCSGKGVVIRDVLSKLLKIAGVEADVSEDPARVKAIDVPVHYGSTRKLNKLIGTFRFTDLEVTLRDSIEDLKARL